MIDNPMFIETHRLAEFNPRGTDVPVVLDLMIHDIDAILSVVHSKVKKNQCERRFRNFGFSGYRQCED